MSILNEARKLRAIVEQAAMLLPDQTASEGVALFPKLKQNGALVSTGTRINWNGVLKRAAVDLWDTQENNPDNAPALWEDIAYRDGIRVIPEVITSTLAFSLDELGWWDGIIYRSLMNGNVYTPAQAPNVWEETK